MVGVASTSVSYVERASARWARASTNTDPKCRARKPRIRVRRLATRGLPIWSPSRARQCCSWRPSAAASAKQDVSVFAGAPPREIAIHSRLGLFVGQMLAPAAQVSWTRALRLGRGRPRLPFLAAKHSVAVHHGRDHSLLTGAMSLRRTSRAARGLPHSHSAPPRRRTAQRALPRRCEGVARFSVAAGPNRRDGSDVVPRHHRKRLCAKPTRSITTLRAVAESTTGTSGDPMRFLAVQLPRCESVDAVEQQPTSNSRRWRQPRRIRRAGGGRSARRPVAQASTSAPRRSHPALASPRADS